MALKNERIIGFVLVLSILIFIDFVILGNVNIIRQIFGFIALAFIPGFLVIKILDYDKFDYSEIYVLSIGLSVSILLMLGLALNLILPFFGFLKPISLIPLIIALNIFILFSLGLTYIKKKSIKIELIYSITSELGKSIPQIIYLALILITGILGALFVQYFWNSIAYIIFIFLICLAIILVCFKKLFSKQFYPWLILIISISLLLSRTLTTPYLFGSDIHYEYFYQAITINNSYWDPTLYLTNVNAMPSVTLLTPEFSIFLNLDSIWIYKIFFSILFASVPLIMYKIFNHIVSEKDAFLSTFVFVGFYSFFTVMLWLPRQQIAELFLVLLILLFIKTISNKMVYACLILIFTFSLVISHYGISYIYLFYFPIILMFIYIFKLKNSPIKLNLVIFSYVCAISWYLYTSGASIINSAVGISDHLYKVINLEVTSVGMDRDIEKAYGSGIFNKPIFHAFGQGIEIIIEVLIVIGIIFVLFSIYRRRQINQEFILFSIISLALLIISSIVPYIGSSLGMNRIYHFTLIFLSVYVIFGVNALLKFVSKIITNFNIMTFKYVIIACIIVPHLLFSTGVIYEISEHPDNFQILPKISTINVSNYSPNRDRTYFSTPIPEGNVLASIWLGKFVINDIVFADTLRLCEPTGYGKINPSKMNLIGDNVPYEDIIYLGEENVGGRLIWFPNQQGTRSDSAHLLSETHLKFEERNLIYNSGSEIFK